MYICQEALIELLIRVLYIEEFCKEAFHEETENISLTPTEELIMFSILMEEINDVLNTLNILAKALKFRRDNAYQPYVPSPLLHRRYRLYNSHRFVEKYIANLFRSFLNNTKDVFPEISKNVKFLLTSDYDVGDTISKYSEELALIRGSFFWREIVSQHPLIIHEIAHKVFNQFKKTHGFEDLRNSLRRIILFLSFESAISLFPNVWIYLLGEDVFADIFSYLVLGDSYLLSLLFGGLLGIGFYSSLVLSDVSDEKVKSFSFKPYGLAFSSFRDKGIVRIKVLLKLRNYLRKKIGKESAFLIDEADDLFHEIENVYLCDLFPDRIKNKFGTTYVSLPPHLKETADVIGSGLNFIANRLFNEFVLKLCEKIDVTTLSTKGSGKPLTLTLLKNGGYHLSVPESRFKVSVIPEWRTDDEVNWVIVINESSFGGKSLSISNLFNVFWYVFLKEAKRTKKIKEVIPQGRLLMAYIFLKDVSMKVLYDFLKEDRCMREVRSCIDEVIFFKSRKLYTSLANGRELSSLERELKKSLGNTFCYCMGVYDGFFLRSGLKISDTPKGNEWFLYKNLLNWYAIADRHNFLKIKISENNHNRYGWKSLFLVKLFEEEEFRRRENNLNYEEELKKFFEILRDYDGLTMIGYSLGWENFILEMNGSLNDIFSLKKSINLSKVVKRSETIIAILDVSSKEVLEKDNSKFRVLVNIRTPRLLGGNAILESFKSLGCEIFLYPGRYDLSITLDHVLTEKEVWEFVRESLFGIQFRTEIEDLVIDVLAKENAIAED
jgi:hypothetical protein